MMEFLPEPGKLYSTQDVGAMLGKSTQTILTWVWKGFIKPVHIGAKNYYKGENLLELLQNRTVRKRRKPKRKKGAGERQTSICEDCLKAFNGCSWSREQKPVLGWDAKKLDIKEYKDRDVYRVFGCPEFEQEKFYVDENGIKRRVNEVPEEWKVHS